MIATRRWIAPLAALLVLTSCGYDATRVPEPDAAPTQPGAAGEPVECDNPLASYSPSGDAEAARAQLINEGRLVVGVSADTFQMGWSNPIENGVIKGFDIDVARDIAEALGVRLQLRVISAADRVSLLQAGEIDLVARNMTVNCDRWSKIGFSAVYYNATQKVLVRADDAEAFEREGVTSLAGKKVCAPRGSTSIDNITEIQPDAEAVAATNHTGCLVKFQQGEVDAITGDDTVLAGLAAQDPYAVVPEQDKLTDEPYGIGVNADDIALIRFVNSVLADRVSTGEWKRSYDTWLKPYLGVDVKAPTPDHSR
ncbi:glutamate ABC transporter substrate-binding protein [Nocardioides caeni]|uniref:Glutamate ABC transporter substrate-binding protein n=1 Tax=Nocardioides caeni TaxID=574700 RepID=A0A4S8NL99_9ACTN|nr:glutamate ABC transporter substrate-binding protein [Nocardioides caeni]THV17787.1 glutamate ABC transporter substrate-binding protein [Nocardioides caeni]